jgi:hypothetical protein
MHKECQQRNRIWIELCQKQNKCRRSHYQLLHMDAEDMRSLQTARPEETPPVSTDKAAVGALDAGSRCEGPQRARSGAFRSGHGAYQGRPEVSKDATVTLRREV